MNALLPEIRFFALLSLGVVGTVFLVPSPAGYPALILLAIFATVLYFTRTWRDRGFYLVCSGEPLVVACSMINPWAGLFSICMLAGIVCEALGISIVGREELVLFTGFCISSLFITLIIHISNHVLVPLVIILGLAAGILAIQSVRIYQFRKEYRGAIQS